DKAGNTGKDSENAGDLKYTDTTAPIVDIIGSEVVEGQEATIKAFISKVQFKDLTITLSNGAIIIIEAGKLEGSVNIQTQRVDDAYKQGETTEKVFISSTSNPDINIVGKEATIKISDDSDVTTVKITAAETTEKVITIDNLQNNQGFTVTAKDPYGAAATISTHTDPAGFGVLSNAEKPYIGQTDAIYSGHTSEIGVVKDKRTGKYLSETIEVEFKNPIQTLDVSFSWRDSKETARVDFYNGDKKVGYAVISGGGRNTSATIKYYDEKGILKSSVSVQGGTDAVDSVYTFKPAGDVTFTKAVFSAEGAGSDYLINSITYKEVVDGQNTTIVGSNEVAFKIETSNIPDPSKYDFKTTFPTAHVKIVDGSNNIVFEGDVNLDKDGKAIVSVRTDGTKDLTATVSDVQGNFEKVDYSDAFTTIVSSLSPQAGNDSITILEDTSYTLKSTDFGDNNQNVAKIKFTELPENGKIYVLKSEYIGSINDRAQYTSSENKIYVEIKVSDIVDISQINKGNVIFVPNKDTDEDGSFKFLVNDGSKWANIESTTTIEVIAVADKPDVQINISERVEKIVNENCDTNDVSGSNGNNGTINPDFNKDDIVINKGDYNNFINKSDLDCGVTLTDKKILDKTNDLMTVDGGMKNHSVNFGGGALNALEVENSINWGNIYGNSGDDTVVVGQNIEKSTVNLGSGDNGLKVEDSIKLSTVHTYSGDDKVVVGKDVDNTTINVGGGTNYLEVGNNVNWSNLFGGAGNDTFVVDGSIDRTTVNLGAGKNSLDIGGELDLSTVHSGSFNDSVSVGRDVKKSTINLGDGKNSIDVDGDVTKSNLFTLSGDDVVNIKKDVSDTVVNLGFGHNEFNSNDFNRSSIHTYSGNDNVTINGDVKQGLINLGAGKNTLDVKGNTEKGTILTGLNKDTIVLEGDVSNTYVNTGSGDDKIFVGGKATATTIDGGAGQDTLYLPKDLSQYSFYDGIVCKKPTTYEDFMAKNSGKYGISCHTFYIVDNETGSTLTVRNIEFLEFNTKASDLIEDSSSSNGGNNDGNIPADAEYLYTYDIDLSAKLKDTDGSETLTVRLEGLPSGIMIDDPRYTYDAVNGAYIVEVDGISFNDTLTFQTYEKIEDEVLNSIKLVAISKESSNESTAMAEVTRDESTIIDGDTRESLVNIKLNGAIYENADNIGRTIEGSNADDIIFGSSGNDYIYGGAGNDTIYTDLATKNGVTQGDVFIDGGTGFDTIKLEGNNDIDFSLLKDASITNIEAIDLTQGNHKLQNLTLDDVLKISGEDNTIKISGDEFDSVTFKNTVGDDGKENAWSKTEGTGADKGYDIYMNSGDPTVQVKVEQPISDGITN
ncbi:hypothetical protein N5U19_11380, partial [Aliarcobacter butzleri]|uniref:immunoglobulin-like domain-containing protein n=1 Tax=Aliarcobacter butzleri TaxID=28197 RepID=UPI0028CB83A3